LKLFGYATGHNYDVSFAQVVGSAYVLLTKTASTGRTFVEMTIFSYILLILFGLLNDVARDLPCYLKFQSG
jgi:hypothetical protein